jgi:hypothetical protein
MKFIAHALLSAILFSFVFPAVAPGIQMHGSFFPEGIVCGFLFAFAGWGLALILGLFTFATLGFGMVLIWIFQLLIPALQLQLMAAWFPSYITVVDWEAAIVGGLCIFAINWLLTNRVTVKVG